jgi:hypothetical protein
MSAKAELSFIMAPDAGGTLRLYGCRGEGKGCARNRYRSRKAPCNDCLLAIETETLAEFQARLNRGDA